MLVDPATILLMLALPAETRFEVEPLGDLPGSPERWRVSTPDGVRSVIVRRPIDPEESANHAAVMEARRLSRIFTFDAGFDAYPGLERISS